MKATEYGHYKPEEEIREKPMVSQGLTDTLLEVSELSIWKRITFLLHLSEHAASS